MSERSIEWLETQRAKQPSKKNTADSLLVLGELIAEKSDDNGIYCGGLRALAEESGFTVRWIRNLLDRLEAAEVVRRVPRWSNRQGREHDALVLAGWADQPHRRPMRPIPGSLRESMQNA